MSKTDAARELQAIDGGKKEGPVSHSDDHSFGNLMDACLAAELCAQRARAKQAMKNSK